MSPSRVRSSVLGFVSIAVLWCGIAGAQTIDETRRALDLAPDPIARSPRMLGMGRLSLVMDASHNRITMWDFAGNPTGIAESESTSTFDLRPGTAARSDLQDFVSGATTRERQSLALREMRVGYEGWRRAGGTAYGAIGSFTRLRHDEPYDSELERRSEHVRPSLMPVLTGPMPFLMVDRMRYALRVQYAYETTADAYKKIVRNGVGDYIDLDGTEVDPPDFFEPDEYEQTGLGIGAAMSYRAGDPLTAAIGIDYISNDIESINEGFRHRTEYTEDRPYTTGQASLIGRYGPIEYGADGRLWRSSSEQRWAFTISQGTGGNPVAARGKLLERREEGGALRTRVRAVFGNFEFGVGHTTYYRSVEHIAPSLFDTTSFNWFRNRLFERTAADSILLPDSVIANEIEQRVWDVGGGVAWHTSDGRLTVGSEFHTSQDLLQSTVTGLGPKRTGWQVRTGAEWWALPHLALRGGYVYRWDDLDDYRESNEFITNGVSVGLGLWPTGAVWKMDLGYLVEWSEADFGDPGLPRGNRQNLAIQFGWAF